MPGGAVGLAATADVNRVEAPVTVKAYLMCAFASFGGIFFGYDSGYINGVNGANYFIHSVQPDTPLNDPNAALSPAHQSLITSILSCGTFFGALIAGDLADIIGRKWTIIMGCIIYIVGTYSQLRRHQLCSFHRMVVHIIKFAALTRGQVSSFKLRKRPALV